MWDECGVGIRGAVALWCVPYSWKFWRAVCAPFQSVVGPLSHGIEVKD